jgi:type IV pilus assembly protein PilM
MAERLINVEVGKRLVRVCLCKKKGKRFQLLKAFMFDTPPGSVNDGDITDPATLGAVLVENLAEHNLLAVKAVTFTLVSGRTATRDVQVPPMSEARVKDLVETNATEYLPIDVSRYKVTYGMIHTEKAGENPGTSLQVIAAPLTILDGYAQFAEEAGLRINAIDFVGNSQFQTMKQVKTQHKVVMCVNVGDSSTYVTFSKDDKLLLQRVLPFGGDDLILEYLAKTGKTDYAAAVEQCSVSLGKLSAATNGALNDTIARERLERLANSIARCLDFFNAGKWKESLDSVVLTGAYAHLAGLREAVSAATEADRKGRIYYLEDQYAAASMGDPALVAKYISCCGATVAPVDLLPDKYKTTGGLTLTKPTLSEGKLTFGIVVATAGFVVGAALSVMALMDYWDATNKRDDMVRTINQLRPVEELYARFNESQQTVGAFSALEEMLDSRNRHLVAFLEELEEKMPPDIKLLSAVFNEDGVLLNINVESFEAAALTIINFRTFRSVDAVEIAAGSRDTDDEAGGVKVSFSLRLTYAPLDQMEEDEEEEEPEAPVEGDGTL